MDSRVHYCDVCGSPLVENDVCARCNAKPAAKPARPRARNAGNVENPSDPANYTYGYVGKWNWGAAILAPFWLMAHNSFWEGLVMLFVGGIPGLNLLSIVIFFYYGFSGNAIALERRAFASESDFVDVQKAWSRWGVGFFAS